MKTLYKTLLLLSTFRFPLFTLHFSLFIFHSSLFTVKAQEIEWQNTIGGTGDDRLYSMQQTDDGGFILGGKSFSNISGDKTENSNGFDDYWIVKTDSMGNLQWQNTIGGSYFDLLYSIQQTADGGYILGGSSRSDISGDKTENTKGGYGNYDYWIVKTDSLGVIQWQNTIGGKSDEILYSVLQTVDGGYILGGYSNSDIHADKTENSMGGSDYWIVKINSTGGLQWQNTIGGGGNDILYTMQQTVDGGYILGGVSVSMISGDKTENCNGGWDYWIVKTDATGNLQWQNTIGGSNGDYLVSIQQTFEGGFILGGMSYSDVSGDKTEDSFGPPDYWIVKTDSIGNLQWQNTIGGSNYDELRSIQQTTDGGYILGGYSSSNISGDKTENTKGVLDYWVLKTDSTGGIQWQNTIGGYENDRLYSIEQTTDEGYILAGHTYSNISGDKTENNVGDFDYWIIKLTNKYNVITGNCFLDLNSNNVQDSGEMYL